MLPPMRLPSTRVLLCLGFVTCGGDPDGAVRAYPIRSMTDAIGGPKAIAREGDLVLDNGHARVAILGARNSLGPGLYGGSLVDADLVRPDPTTAGGQGRDQLAELFATVNMNVAHPGEGQVEIVEAGGDEAVIRASGAGEGFLTLLDALWAIVSAPDFTLWSAVTTDLV